ncbi:hypothetical protein LX36DRAFT_653555 [Colletotrichum falcatum]|nr:hypothetical protein LX36DRAFT_653555 [Colletotrichum falcatum]
MHAYRQSAAPPHLSRALENGQEPAPLRSAPSLVPTNMHAQRQQGLGGSLKRVYSERM